jgi:hypothetical protein
MLQVAGVNCSQLCLLRFEKLHPFSNAARIYILSKHMKRNCCLLKLLLVLFIMESCAPDKVKNDLTSENIKGAAKSITVQYYQAIEKFGAVQEGELTGAKISKYNKSGFIIENDEIARRNFYGYAFNKSNLPTEKNTYNSDSSLVSKQTYKYDENGNKTEENTYSPDGALHIRSIFKPDENGNAVEESNYDGKGVLLSRYIYEYNEKGHRIQYNGYRGDGKRMNRFMYKYDDAGNVIQENQFLLNSDDSSFSVSTITYKYPELDKGGNWIRQLVLNEQKTVTAIRNRELEYY